MSHCRQRAPASKYVQIKLLHLLYFMPSERHTEHKANAPFVCIRTVQISQAPHIFDVEYLKYIVYTRHDLDIRRFSVHYG